MGLKYNASGNTYDLSGPQYTDIRGAKRLNYIASGKTYQLGLATDSTASQYSPLKMKVSDSTYYIGRSQSNSTSKSYTTNFTSRYGYTEKTNVYKLDTDRQYVFESFRSEYYYDDGRFYKSESYTTSLTAYYGATYATFTRTVTGRWSDYNEGGDYDKGGPLYEITSNWTEPCYLYLQSTTYIYCTKTITTSSSTSSSTSANNFV